MTQELSTCMQCYLDNLSIHYYADSASTLKEEDYSIIIKPVNTI